MENKFHSSKKLIATLAILLLSFAAIPALSLVPVAHASPAKYSTFQGYFTATTASPFYRSTTPITDTPVAETINPDGSVTVSVGTLYPSGTPYYDAGIYFAAGTLGGLTDLTIQGSGSIYVNLWVNPQTWVWTSNTLTSYDGFGAFGPDASSSSWTISQSSEVGLYTPTGSCNTYGPYTLAELQSECGLSADTLVALWVGTSTMGTDSSVTVNSINGIPLFTGSSNIADDAASCLGWGGTYVLSSFTCYVGSPATVSSDTTFHTNIDILSGASLTISSGAFASAPTFTIRGTLTIETGGSLHAGVGYGGTFVNRGTTTDHGALTVGYGSTFDNRGSLVVDNSAGLGVLNFWLLENHGTITVTNPGAIGIDNYHEFDNSGSISIGNSGGYGFWNAIKTSTVDNTGAVTVGNSGGTGFANYGTVDNSGALSISNTAGTGFHNHLAVTNEVGATVTIENSGGVGLLNAGTFTNSGSVDISSTGTYGMYTTDVFANSGTVTITNSVGIGVAIEGTFSNTGTINIDNSGGDGLVNYGKMTNTGTINIGNSGGFGLNNTGFGTFENYGTINVGNTGGAGIRNQTPDQFINESDGTINAYVSGWLYYSSSITNDGMINLLY